MAKGGTAGIGLRGGYVTRALCKRKWEGKEGAVGDARQIADICTTVSTQMAC